MALEDDIVQAQQESSVANEKQTIFFGTVVTVSPLTVTLAGSGVPVPCLNSSGVTLAVDRKVSVIMVGSDLTVVGSYGSDVTLTGPVVLSDLTVTSLKWAASGKPNSISKANGATTNQTGTSTSFTSLGLGVAFVAPPSGRVMVNVGGRVYVLVANGSACISAHVKTGSTVDSGSSHATPNDVYAVEIGGTTAIGDYITGGASRLIEGLTPGEDYNVTLYHKASPANSGGSTKATVSVVPVL